MAEDLNSMYHVNGLVKWFDPGKGFGFVLADDGGPDILLHINVLRNFGQSSVADGARIEIVTHQTDRGVQAIEVVSITPPECDGEPVLSDFADLADGVLDDAPLEPARIKWFDKGKGFGFANVFGSSEDVFVHIEVLRQSGLADLQPGEAMAMRVVDGKRGRMAAKVMAWEFAVNGVPAEMPIETSMETSAEIINIAPKAPSREEV
ncbi:MAG: cold shock domain-containing protein [Rhodobacteraceae bacterium]|nr:cold shock domain-containing protein [Paracoccaceae bacterium]